MNLQPSTAWHHAALIISLIEEKVKENVTAVSVLGSGLWLGSGLGSGLVPGSGTVSGLESVSVLGLGSTSA